MKPIPKAIFTFIIIALCSFAMGCEYLDARDAAHAGERALRRCEFSRAYWNFIYAQDVFPNHGDIRLGLAISDLLTFLSEPNVVALMERLGIDLRVESLCEDDSAVGGEPIEPPSNRDPNPGIEAPKCLVLNSLMQTTPGTGGGSDNDGNDKRYYDDIDETLMWNDIVVTLLPYRARLIEMAKEFRQSAEKIDDTDGYGIDFASRSTTIFPWDMNLVSSALLAIVVILDLAEVYDTGFSVVETFRILSEGTCEEIATYLNEHVFLGRSNVSLTESTWPMAQVMFERLWVASDEAYRWKEGQLNGKTAYATCPILNWQKTPFGILKDISRIAHAFGDPPYMTDWIVEPAIYVRLEGFLSNVPVRSEREGDRFTCTPNGEISWNGISFAERVNASCEPLVFDIIGENVSIRSGFHYRLSSAWLKWHVRDFFDIEKSKKK